MTQYLQTSRVFVFVLFLGLFTMAVRPITDPDVWWHLRTGQLILENHRIPHTDPYSFTKSSAAWIDHEWLAQVLIYETYRLASWSGLIIEFALIISAAFAIAFLRSAGRPYVAGAMTAWGAVASVPSWGVRPQMVSLLLASLFLLLLERSQQRSRLLWWMPPLMLLWVNLHAGYALGIVFLVLYLVGSALDQAFGQSELPNSSVWFRRAGIVCILCLAAVPLNPYGFHLYVYPLETLRSTAMLAYIGEWHSPDFHQPQYLALLLMLLATLFLAAISPRRLRPRELLLLTATAFATLRSVRHIPIFVLVAVPLISAMVQAWLEEREYARVFVPRSGSITRVKIAINAWLLVSLVVLGGARAHHVISHQVQAEAREFPTAATSFLAQTRPPAPILNHYNWGGYLIWKLYPAYPVFIDGRADVYGDAFVNDFVSAYYLRGRSWQGMLEQWHIRIVMLPPDSPLVVALQSLGGWRIVYGDRQVVVLSRGTAPIP